MGVYTMPINEEIMSCGVWREILILTRKRCDLMDEINIVTAFHRVAKLYRENDSGRTPLEEVHRADGIRILLKHVWHFAVRCRPQQLANALWACAVLNLHHDTLLQRLCDYAVLRISGYTTQNVANTVWALATLGFMHDGFLNLVVDYTIAQVQAFTPQDLANTCWAFAKLQRPCDILFKTIVAESLLRLDSFQAQNMSNLVWGCATVMYRDEASMQTIAEYGATCVEEFSPQELSNLTWGLATLQIHCDDWLEASGDMMAKRTRECCPQDMSNTIWAYGTLMHKRNEHLRAINWEVMRQIEHFSSQGLSNVAWGLSATEYRDQYCLTCISEEVIRRPSELFTPPDISTLLYSFAILAWKHEGALAKLRRLVRKYLPVFATRDVANVSWALVTLSHRDDEIFRRLHQRAADNMPDFTVQGLCNIAWAFVRFGTEVPNETVLGIANETVRRRAELADAPGDAVLLSDAVCSEWAKMVPRSVFELCDAIGREPYNTVVDFLADLSNVPSLGAAPADIQHYKSRVTGFGCVQLGRRMTVELLAHFGILETERERVDELRVLRERWLWQEIQDADPLDASMQHKTTCTWALSVPGYSGKLGGVSEVLASGSPMNADMRFVPCVVEHSRASDAEFQVVNKAAERIILGGAADVCCRSTGLPPPVLRLDVSEIPCLSCLGALRQFQKAFPGVQLRVSFNIRKVAEVCEDKSADGTAQEQDPPPRSHMAAPPDNRGRPPGRGQAAQQQQLGARSSGPQTGFRRGAGKFLGPRLPSLADVPAPAKEKLASHDCKRHSAECPELGEAAVDAMRRSPPSLLPATKRSVAVIAHESSDVAADTGTTGAVTTTSVLSQPAFPPTAQSFY